MTLRRLASRIVLVFASAGLVACMKPNPLLYTLGEDDETGTGTTTDSDTGDDETSETGEPEGLPSMPMPDLGSPSCAPFEDFEPACGACLADNCCELTAECVADSACLCLVTCTASGGSNGTCSQECGVKPKDAPLFEMVRACADQACSSC